VVAGRGHPEVRYLTNEPDKWIGGFNKGFYLLSQLADRVDVSVS
jgi:hypothetical protein